MQKLAVLKEVLVEQGWSQTKGTPIGPKWIDINEGDGDRVENRSRLRDDVFSATPPLEAMRLLMSLMMTEIMQARSYKLMFIDISRAHFHSPSRRRVFVGLCPNERSVWCGSVDSMSMYGTQDAAANFAAIVMDTLTNMKLEVGEFNQCLCQTCQEGH